MSTYYHINVLSLAEIMSRPGQPQPQRLRLAEIRKRLGLSQAEVATSMGATQSGVSRLERQDDHRVSTLREYAAALGGRLCLIVDCGERRFEVSLNAGEDEPAAAGRRDYRVIWQDLTSRALVHVGWLEFTGSQFVFSYTDDARINERFEPFPAFPLLDQTYRSDELFPFFAVRLISTADPTYHAVLDAIGLTRSDASPAELLARSPDAQHDTIQVVPEPTEAEDGTLVRTFLVSGVRHADELLGGALDEMIAALKPGAPVELVPEPTNPYNPRALQVVHESTVIGWLPDYLVDEVHGYLDAGRPTAVTIERANGPETPWHVRVQCRLTVAAASG